MKSILVVSNDDQLLQLLDSQLSGLGFSLETMEACDNMLQQIRNKKPDVLLIDFILGDANAAEICHQVTSDPDIQDMPVILLSDMPGIDQLAVKLGSFAVIKKPMSTAELAENVIRALVLHQQPN